MENSQYTPPQSDLSNADNSIAAIIAPLLASKPWVRLCSILGFISTGFMILAALSMMFAGASMGLGGAAGVGAGFFYLLFGLLYLMPSLFLFRYASAIAHADESRQPNDIAIALTHQKSFWKFVGILVLISLILMVLGIGSAVLIPILAA
jgi:hypothetical protein